MAALPLLLSALPVPSYKVDPPARTHESSPVVRLAPVEAPGREVAMTPLPTPTPMPEAAPAHSPASYGLPDDAAKAFIYQHESGNDPTRYNSTGCLGLGQACPGSKLLVVCPTMDYACEDAFFTRYMEARYGTWSAALAFWQRTDARPYPGHWW